MTTRGGMLLLLLLLALPVAAAAPETFRVPDRAVGCRTLAEHAYDEVPRLFAAADPDSLLTLLDRWDLSCGPHELILRTRLLGAIWDGAFDESLYDQGIVEYLQIRAEEFGRGPAPDPARARYDAFTVDLADQMLPHQPRESLEEFFCLFYAGRTAEAWDVLDSPALAGTSLAFRRELAREQAVARGHWTVGLGAGSWDPVDELTWVGDKPLFGLSAGLRGPTWLLRLLGEWRPGRTDQVYWVTRDGVDYLSDRWDTLLLGGEIGRRFVLISGWEFQLLAGAGTDLIRPFESDDLVLGALHTSVGAGMRSELYGNSGWIWGFDVRHEWIAERNEEAMNLGGRAWSLRLVVEWLFVRDKGYEIELLTR